MRIKDFNQIIKDFPDTAPMPVLFVGHGSPMNAIEENQFTRQWAVIGQSIPTPAAILCISAHWLSRGTFVTAMDRPQTIHDFYGFPQALNEVEYGAAGSPILAQATAGLLDPVTVGMDNGEWGLDHGSWSVLKHIYPAADIPVVELSIDYTQGMQWHYELGQELSQLRRKGVLVMGSGNMVHNLRMINWHTPNGGFDWANEANIKFKELLSAGYFDQLIAYNSLGREVQLSVPTPDHFIPMLYTLGLKQADENISFFNDKTVMGSLSMTSFVIQ